MKSPVTSVGIIDADGILKGSNRKDRINRTTSRIGKKDLAYSTMTGSGPVSEEPSERLQAL